MYITQLKSGHEKVLINHRAFLSKDYNEILFNLKEIQKCFEDEAVSCRDFCFDLDHFDKESKISRIQSNGGTLVSGKFFLDAAYSQLLAHLGMPVGYIKSCPEELRGKNINYWLKHYGNKKLLFRKYILSNWATSEVTRSVASLRYPPLLMDNLNVLESINKAIKNNLDQKFHNSSFDQLKDFRYSCYSTFFGEAANIDIAFGTVDGKLLGIQIQNSETGRGSLQIHPFISYGENSVILNVGTFSSYLNHTIGNAQKYFSKYNPDLEQLIYKSMQGCLGMLGHLLLESEKMINPAQEVKKLETAGLPPKILNELEVILGIPEEEDVNRITTRIKKGEILSLILDIIKRLGYFSTKEIDGAQAVLSKIEEYRRATEAISNYYDFRSINRTSLSVQFEDILND